MKAQVERLYEVFAAPRPRVVDFCDHCVEPADVAHFTTVPLRELTPDHVEKFWFAVGDDRRRGVRALPAPRVLDLISQDVLDADFFWLGLATKAHAAGEQSERRAIEEYFLTTPRALAALVEDLTSSKNPDERLAAWLRGPEPPAVLEDAALTGPDQDGVCSAAHLALEAWR